MSGVSPSDGSCSRATVGRPSSPATSVHERRSSGARAGPCPRGQVHPAAHAPGDHQARVAQHAAPGPGAGRRRRWPGAMLSSSDRSARALRPWSSITATVIAMGRPKRASPRRAMSTAGALSAPPNASFIRQMHQEHALVPAVTGHERRGQPPPPARPGARAAQQSRSAQRVTARRGVEDARVRPRRCPRRRRSRSGSRGSPSPQARIGMVVGITGDAVRLERQPARAGHHQRRPDHRHRRPAHEAARSGRPGTRRAAEREGDEGPQPAEVDRATRRRRRPGRRRRR